MIESSYETTVAPKGPYVDSHVAAEYLGVNVGTVGIWRCKETGPPYHLINTRVRYILSELDAWIATNHTKLKVSPNVGRPPKKKGKKKAAR